MTYADICKPKVVVIGAGLAGLTIAYRLNKAGIDVEVYEARPRIGGRIFTVDLTESHVELGGQTFRNNGQHVHLLNLINELGLKIASHSISSQEAYFTHGTLVPLKHLAKIEIDTALLREHSRELIEKKLSLKILLDSFIKETDPIYKAIAMKLAIYEGNLPEYLSPLYVDTFLSMVSKIYTPQSDDGLERLSIKGGNRLIPEALAKEISHRIHLGMPLTKVTRNVEGSLQLTFDNGETKKADILVLAIPCSVYEKISFQNDLIPFDRLKAIQMIPYGAHGKMVFPFSCSPGRVLGLISDEFYCSLDAGCRLLTMHYFDDGSLSAKALYNRARSMMELGYLTVCPTFEAPQEVADQSFCHHGSPLSYSWSQNRFSKGTYAYIAPGQENLWHQTIEEDGECFKILFKPIENKIYFTGEHATLPHILPGTMEGACESGERIARAIIKRHL